MIINLELIRPEVYLSVPFGLVSFKNKGKNVEASSKEENKNFTEIPFEESSKYEVDIPLLAEPPCQEGLEQYNKYLIEETKAELFTTDAEATAATYRRVVRDLFSAHSYIKEIGDNKHLKKNFLLINMTELIEGLIVKYKKAGNDVIGYAQDPSDIFGG